MTQSIEAKAASMIAEEYKRRSARIGVDPFTGLCAGLANVTDRANSAHAIHLCAVNATRGYGPDSQLRQALWSFIRGDARPLAEYAAKLDTTTYTGLAAKIREILAHFPEVQGTPAHAAYWKAQAADAAWSEELRSLFGASAGEWRYTEQGRGEPGSPLRLLYERFVAESEALRVVWNAARGGAA